MAEFTLAANSKIDKSAGKLHKAPAGATKVRKFVIYRFDPDSGANPRMARAQGVKTSLHIYLGMALSNALVALGGSLFAQTNGFADVTSGVGTIVVGLAAVIIGETLFHSRLIIWALIGCVVGSVLYRIAIQLALSSDILGLKASDLNLVTAVLVAAALVLPRLRRGRAAA